MNFIPHSKHNPAMRAARVYFDECCSTSFEEDLDAHLIHGHVVSTPEYFIMARPVKRDAPAEYITDAMFYFPPEECDCWHIWLAAGDWRKFWENDTLDLPWVSWEKRNKLKVYPMETVKKKVLK